MSRFLRVVWSEGMLLAPHHFQQAEHHILGEVEYRLDVALPFAWGVRRLSIDADALSNGRFTLLELEAVLPDGTAVRTPSIDPTPPGRDLTQEFGADRSSLDVFLALPEGRPGLPRCWTPQGDNGVELEKSDAGSRFVGEPVRVIDENSPGVSREVVVARQNLKVLVSGESLDGCTTLCIARLERSEAGAIVLTPSYAPPSLVIGRTGLLSDILRGFVERLTANSDSLKQNVREVGPGVQFGTGDVELFHRLSTVNAVIPEVQHFLAHPDVHPVVAYRCLARLLGSLCTFSPSHRAADIPSYDHDRLGETFVSLQELLVELLKETKPSRHETFPLPWTEEEKLSLDIKNIQLFDSGHEWFISVRGDLPEAQVRDEIPTKLTIGASHNVDFLVGRALPGIGLTYTAIPASDFPIKSGYVYFRLESHGEIWDTIRDARDVAIYVTGADLRKLSYELIVTQS